MQEVIFVIFKFLIYFLNNISYVMKSEQKMNAQ